jgi:hypothetical protein
MGCLLAKVAVTGRRLARRGDDPDEWPRHRIVVQSHPAHESPVWSAIYALGGNPRPNGK